METKARVLLALERAGWAVGFAALAAAAAARLDGAWFQHVEQRRFEAAVARAPAAPPAAWAALGPPDVRLWSAGRTRAYAAAAPFAAGHAVALLEIPAIELRAVVVPGSDTRSLDRAIGHIPGTASPGSRGNVALAAHRDGFFRRLGELVAGDRIVLRSLRDVQVYAVESSAVVSPAAVEVLADDGTAVLTLVTCHPFYYVGSAPERYVVRAALAPAR